MNSGRCAASEAEAAEDARLASDDAIWKVYGKAATEEAAKSILNSRESWDATGDALSDFSQAELCNLAHWIVHNDLLEVGRIVAKKVMEFARAEAADSPKAMEIARRMDAEGSASARELRRAA